jgi:cytosine deaminase
VAILAEAGIAIMTNTPGDHLFPPVLALRKAGATVFAGNDDILDSWWPYGDATDRACDDDRLPLRLLHDELLCAFDFVTAIAAKVLDLANYGLRVGASVDLIVPDADHAPTTVVARPVRRAVYKAGHIVTRDGVLLGRQGNI